MEQNICIRLERKSEQRDVENLIRESFWNVYRPGCTEHYLINQLRKDAAFIPELDFVLEADGKLIGQALYAKAVLQVDGGKEIPALTLGPICILPQYKRKGYGKMLLDYTLKQAAGLGHKLVFLEGNIGFYGKSGFKQAGTYGIRYSGLPEGEDASFFLLKELEPGCLNGITGIYADPQVYFVNETQAEEFDKGFAKKEKLKLPGQLF